MRLHLPLLCSLFLVPAYAIVAPAPVSAATPAQTERVEVKRGNSWYPAAVIKRDGTKALVHYDGLSNDFDEWVGPERMREAAVRPTVPAEPTEPSPAKAKKEKKEKADEDAAPPEIEDDEAEAGQPAKKLARPDYAGVKNLHADPATAPKTWALKADEPAASTPAKLSTAAIALHHDADKPGKPSRWFGESIENPVFAGLGAARAIMARYCHVSGGNGTACRLEFLDLAAGRSALIAEMPVNTRLLDFSPDGGSVLLRDDKWGEGGKTRLDVFSYTPGKKPEHAVSWKPYQQADERNREVAWAGFVDNAHVLTTGGDGSLILWEWSKPRAIYTMKLEGNQTPELSPGHKYLLVSGNNDWLTVYEALTGKLVAAQQEKGLWGCKFEFRPDGKQFLAAGWGRIRVWDFETGKQVSSSFLPPKIGHFGTNWLESGYVMLDKHCLYDLSRGLALWEYEGRGLGQAGVYGGRYWYTADGALTFSHVLASTVLPHPAAKKATADLKPEEYLAVRPGVSVSVEINVEAPGDGQEQVTKSIKSKLMANGLTIADGRPIKFVATTTPGETREIVYHGFGMGGGGKVSAQEKKLRVAFEMEGKTLWENVSMSGPPPMLSLKKDQTIDQAVAENMANAWQFFKNVEIPKQVAKVSDKPGYGTSRLTARGLQEGGDNPQEAGKDTRRPTPAAPRRTR